MKVIDGQKLGEPDPPCLFGATRKLIITWDYSVADERKRGDVKTVRKATRRERKKTSRHVITHRTL